MCVFLNHFFFRVVNFYISIKMFHFFQIDVDMNLNLLPNLKDTYLVHFC